MKEIKLSNGLLTMVDDEDYEMLLSHTTNWRYGVAGVEGNSKLITNPFNGYLLPVSMPRLLMGCTRKDGKVVDHIDRNRLNNQKGNLRIVTMSQNLTNKRKLSNRSSKYKGVYWIKGKNKWRVNVGGRTWQEYGGYFTNELEAAKKANELMKKLHGKFAVLNEV